MALQDYYNIDDDSAFTGICGDRWRCQTFTANSDYSLASIKLKLYRVGSPGILTIAITAVDGVGKPIDEDLTTGTVNVNTITTDSDGEWIEITLTEYDLLNGEKYAIITKCLDGNSSNYVDWCGDNSSPAYPNGAGVYSNDGGDTWTVQTTWDLMFETYSAEIISGSIAGGSDADGSLSVAIELQDSVVGASGVDASLNVVTKLRSSAIGASTVSTPGLNFVLFTGFVAGASGVDGFLSDTIKLQGSIAGASTVNGHFISQLNLGSSAVEISSVGASLGTLTGIWTNRGFATGISSVSGSLSVTTKLRGDIAETSDISCAFNSQPGCASSVVGISSAFAFLNFTYLFFEQSEDSGSPIELYYFINILDSTVWTYNNSDSDIVYNGLTYTAALIRRGDIQLNSNSLKSQVEIFVSSSNPFIRNYIQEPIEGVVQLTIYRQHFGSYVTYWKGSVASAKFKPKIGVIIANLKMSSLKRFGLMLKFQRNCGLPLYTTRCDPLGTLKANKKVTGTIFSVDGTTIISTDFLIPGEDGWFTGGIFKTDDDSCLQKIVYHVGSTIKIVRPVSVLTAGNTFTAWAGCDHDPDTCEVRFDNSINYGGQLYLPDKNPFTGDPIV